MTYYEQKIIRFIYWTTKNNDDISIKTIRKWFRKRFSDVKDKEFNELILKMLDEKLLEYSESTSLTYSVYSTEYEDGTTKVLSKEESEKDFLTRQLSRKVALSFKSIEFINENQNIFFKIFAKTGLRYAISLIISRFIVIYLFLMPQ